MNATATPSATFTASRLPARRALREASVTERLRAPSRWPHLTGTTVVADYTITLGGRRDADRKAYRFRFRCSPEAPRHRQRPDRHRRHRDLRCSDDGPRPSLSPAAVSGDLMTGFKLTNFTRLRHASPPAARRLRLRRTHHFRGAGCGQQHAEHRPGQHLHRQGHQPLRHRVHSVRAAASHSFQRRQGHLHASRGRRAAPTRTWSTSTTRAV